MIISKRLLIFPTTLWASIISAVAHDSHDGLRHWEIPSKDPDRIILTFHGDPSTSRAVTWRTDNSITKAKAEIAEIQDNSKFQESAVSFDAVTEPFDLGEHKSNKSLTVHNHSVVFKELKPDTNYLYRVGDGQKYWSEWIQFKTAKPGYGKSQFVYFGDAQNDVLNHWSRVIRMAYKTAPEASFAVHAGDLINLAHRDHEWAQWFKAGGFIHSQWTAIPVAGNHEFMPPGRHTKETLHSMASAIHSTLRGAVGLIPSTKVYTLSIIRIFVSSFLIPMRNSNSKANTSRKSSRTVMQSGKLSPATILYSLPPVVETFALVENNGSQLLINTKSILS